MDCEWCKSSAEFPPIALAKAGNSTAFDKVSGLEMQRLFGALDLAISASLSLQKVWWTVKKLVLASIITECLD
jgi:hypothetical protein